MEELRLGAVESQFADIIWNEEPVSSGELVKVCEKELGWKKSTTYTMLKRLCERGIFQNEKGTVQHSWRKRSFPQHRARNLWRIRLRDRSRLFSRHLRQERN